jgi:ADP-heptose:LPS heptosyltransferase
LLKFFKKVYRKIGLGSARSDTVLYGVHSVLKTVYRILNDVLHGRPVRAEALVRQETDPEDYLFQVRRVLLIKGDHVGDFLMAVPAIKVLRANFPGAHWTLWCSPWNEKLARQSGLFDEIFVAVLDLDKKRSGKIASEELEKAAQLAGTLPAFDLAVNLKVEDNTNFLLDRVQARIIAGFNLEKPNSPTVVNLPNRNDTERWYGGIVHNRELLLFLAGAVAARVFSLHQPLLGDSFLEFEGSLGQAIPGHTIGINLGAGSPLKCWPSDMFVELIQNLLKDPARTVVLLGGPAEVENSRRVAQAFRGIKNFLDLTDQFSLAALPTVMKKLEVYVGHDTGTTHMAALYCPTVCLFSGTTPVERWKPYGKDLIILRYATHCTPCFLSTLDQCHFDQRCLRQISVATVAKAVLRFLG